VVTARVTSVVVLVVMCVRPARAQTVAEVAARGVCSTAGVEGISQQLAETQMCLRPGAFVRFAPHPGITLSSSRVHPYLQATARDALHRAAARQPITVNSAFRTLADQYVLYFSGGCGLAARPGSSNHQSGRAIDVASYATVRGALEAEGCTWLGSRDPVHFDCPGTDRRSDSVLAFQRLWNVNRPSDPIAEDGVYGPQTESRLARSPAAGFASSACGCTPGCDGDVVVADDCSRRPCASGQVCAGGSAPRCVDAACATDGTRCEGEATVLVCSGGVGMRTPCAPGETCMGGVCRPSASVPCAGVAGTVCLDAWTLGFCGDGLERSMACPAGCAGSAGSARCVAELDAGAVDAGLSDAGLSDAGGVSDAGPVDAPPDGGRLAPEIRRAVGGCSAGGRRAGAGWLGVVLIVAGGARRRRRRAARGR